MKNYRKIVNYSNLLQIFESHIKESVIKEVKSISLDKQKYWDKMVDGYHKIDDLKTSVIDLSRRIVKFKKRYQNFIEEYRQALNPE